MKIKLLFSASSTIGLSMQNVDFKDNLSRGTDSKK